jgi:hypothetical protein
MSIQVTWADTAHTIVHLQFAPGWGWADVNAAIQQADTMIISQPHPVNLLIDIREAGRLPGNFMQMAGDLFSQGEARPNEGKKIVIGAGALIRMAYKGFLKVYGHKLQGRPLLFADSLNEAQTLLAG